MSSVSDFVASPRGTAVGVGGGFIAALITVLTILMPVFENLSGGGESIDRMAEQLGGNTSAIEMLAEGQGMILSTIEGQNSKVKNAVYEAWSMEIRIAFNDRWTPDDVPIVLDVWFAAEYDYDPAHMWGSQISSLHGLLSDDYGRKILYDPIDGILPNAMGKRLERDFNDLIARHFP